jgi:hypothetical protein
MLDVPVPIDARAKMGHEDPRREPLSFLPPSHPIDKVIRRALLLNFEQVTIVRLGVILSVDRLHNRNVESAKVFKTNKKELG